MASDVLGRLAILHAQYTARLDGGMLDLIARAWEVHDEAVARAEETADRAYLNGLLEGIEDILSEDTFSKLEPMFTRYAEGTEMFALLEKAAEAFGAAVHEVAAQALARFAIDEARRGSTGGEE
ncbi:MAG: hypothetical protein ACRYGA_13490 [Janthinobacterium lividum]